MALRIDYSQNRKLYVGTTAEVTLGDGETIIDNKLIIGGSSSSLMLDVASDAIIGSINTLSSTTNYENKLIVAGKNNYSDGTTWFGSYGQILLSSNTNMTGSSRQFLITNALDNNKFAIIRSVDASTNPVTNSTGTGVNSGTADLVIDNTGKVGIGTTSPGVKLTVVTPNVVNTAVNVLKLGDDTNGLVFKSYFDTSGIAWRLNKGLAGINMVTLSQGGKVGIGNTNPSDYGADANNLVVGSLSGNNGITILSTSSSGYGSIFFADASTGNKFKSGFIRYQQNISDMTFGTNEEERMRLTLEGYLGIDDTNPNAKLQVDNGAIKIRNIVDSSPGSDVRRNINIATFDGQGSTFTGKLIIETPVMTTGAMGKFKISGWQYDESWDLTVSGYLRIGTGRGWQQIGGAILTGNPPFDVDEVRLCYNSTTNIFYIILGDASTFWDYYASIVIDADSYYQDSVPTTGWDMSIATADPSGLTSDITLTNIAEYGSSNAIIPGSLAVGSYSTNGRLNVTEGDAEMIFGSASSARPWLRLKHNIAPADGEEIGLQDFNGFNDADEDTRYAIWTAKAEDVTDGSEDGSLTLMTMTDGSLENTLTGRSGKVGIGTTDPVNDLNVNGDIGYIGVIGQGNIYGNTGNSSYANMQLYNPSTGYSTFNNQSYGYYFLTGGGTKVTILNNGNLGINTTNPTYKLSVSGAIEAGGKLTYSKSSGSLNTTGYAVAGLTAGFNGASAGFEFKCYGGNSKYQRIVYSCHCSGTNWYSAKVIDEGTNDLDVVASANGATITFTFKATSGTQSYSPRILIEATGHSINSTYA